MGFLPSEDAGLGLDDDFVEEIDVVDVDDDVDLALEDDDATELLKKFKSIVKL